MRVAIDRAQHPVFAGSGDHPARRAVHGRAEHRRWVGHVPVMRVVRHQLTMPPQRAGADVEHDQRVGVEVVALTEVDRQIGRRIGDGDVHVPGLRVDRKRRPHRPAADRNPFRVLPRLEARLARLGNRVETPHRRSVGGAERADPALKIVLAAGGTDEDEVLEHHRRHRERFALGHRSPRVAPRGARRFPALSATR